MKIENEEIKQAIEKIKHKGDAIVLSGTTGSGKSTIISELAKHENVQSLLQLREAQGKGSTAETCIIVTDYEAIPEDCLFVSAQLQKKCIADCSDDNVLLAKILLSGIEDYKNSKNTEAYKKKIIEAFHNALKRPANESLAYKLRNYPLDSDNGKVLREVLESFCSEEILVIFQELLATNPKKSANNTRTHVFTNMLSKNNDFSARIQEFWNIVVEWLNNDLEQLKKDLKNKGAMIDETENSSTFLIALNIDDLDDSLTQTLLKSEDSSKEYLLSDLSLIFRGKSNLFKMNNSQLLTVSESDGTPIRCWKFIDTQGLFHSLGIETTDEANRVLDILSTYHSNRLLFVINSVINNTSKDGDMAICEMLSKANRPVEIYFFYSHWDEYLGGYAARINRSQIGKQTKDKWNSCYEQAALAQRQRDKDFEDAVNNNSAKRKPSIKGFFYGALLFGGSQNLIDCLEHQQITYEQALLKLLEQVLKEQAKLGTKYRVTAEFVQCFQRDIPNMGTTNISALYNNLVCDCKGKRLYASTVRACWRKWCRTGTKHTAHVAVNTSGFEEIETKFVEEIRNYAMKYCDYLKFNFKPYVFGDADMEQLQTDLLQYLKASQCLGRETAKKIGAQAYLEEFKPSDEKTPVYLYLYQHLDNMFSYVQTKYFPAPQIPFTDTFKEIFFEAVTECIQQFVDSRCVVVY